MRRNHQTARAILRAVERSGRRSTLFWWFVDHHEEMARAAAAGRIDWSAFCAEASKIGLTDTRGQPASERNARETWRQARKAVAKAAASGEMSTSRRLMPSRLPKDWRPQVVPVPPSAVGTAGTLQVLPPPVRQGDEELSDHAKKEFAKFDAMLARHDKKFRF